MSEKLRPVAVVVDELFACHRGEACVGLQAERDATVALGLDRLQRVSFKDASGYTVVLLADARNHLLDIAKPPESERERLGRVMYEWHPQTCGWSDLEEKAREICREKIDAILDEQVKIQEETE